jgi:hypothetical protein
MSVAAHSGRRSLVIAVLLLSCLLSTACAPSQAQRVVDVANLSKSFDILERLEVRAYRNQDWCQNIWYKRGVFSDYSGEADTCNLFLGIPSRFDGQAQADFAAVAEAIRATHVKLHYISDLDYALDHKLTYAEFHLATGSDAYIYSPGYTDLPKDLPGEIEYSRINADWYYMWMDWN